VHVLEEAGLLTSRKVGRVRTCKLGPRRLEDETAWIREYRQHLEARDGMLSSGMETGMNQSYAALDKVLSTLG
jgi:hypothetical protein